MDFTKSHNKSQKNLPCVVQCRNMGLAKSHFGSREAAKSQTCIIDCEKLQQSVARRRYMVYAKSQKNGLRKVAQQE